MGLQGSLNDCSSDSILILAIALVATGVRYIRSLFTLLEPVCGEFVSPIGSGLASLVILAEQLNKNRLFSNNLEHEGENASSKCLICLSKMREGEEVRRLKCFHMFHKGCFDGWLGQLGFSCPLCREPLVEERHMEMTKKRTQYDVLSFFSMG